MLPAWLHATLLVVVALVILGAAGQRPAPDRRAQRPVRLTGGWSVKSGLRHRPLAVLTDRPVVPGAEALWRAHVARAAAQIGRLRVGTPRPGLAALDPRALRGALVVALFACLVIAGDRRAAAARAGDDAGVRAAGGTAGHGNAGLDYAARLYGLAPLFLRHDGKPVTVPAGSRLTVNLTGGAGTPSLYAERQDFDIRALWHAASFQADRDLPSAAAWLSSGAMARSWAPGT